MKNIFTLTLLLFSYTTFGQSRTEWREDFKIMKSDFQAQPPKTRENVAKTYFLAGGLDFGYAMSNYEFMLTKNFNKHVTAYIMPSNSWLQEGDQTQTFVQLAQMQFDLLELYARKFRKKLHDSKGAFSNYDFYKQASDEVNAELGRKQVEMQDAVLESENKALEYHQQIKEGIVELSDYCKECKPAKDKKKAK